MLLGLLILCYLVTIGLLALALVGISSPARWSRLSFAIACFILLVLLLETLLIGGLALLFC